MKRTFTLILFSIFFQFSQSSAQSTSGTEFWLTFMENLTLDFNGPPSFSIHISSDVDTNGEISVPATGFTQAFSVNAGTQIELVLPAAIWYSEVSEQIEGKGIKITSEADIQVSATHFRLFFTESSGVLPVSELSDEYFTTCFIEDNPIFPSSLVVVATEDDTEVEIIPAAFTLGLHAQDVPFNVTLDEGDIYQVQALGDLTGTNVRSLNGEKLAVFSGSQQARIVESCDGFADNHLWEQSQPFSNWAKLYYFVPFKNQGQDLVRILAKEDGTIVNLDCGDSFLLNRGDFNDLLLGTATVITATNDIAVTQFNQSQNCNPSNTGDPTMLRLFPTDKQTQNAKWWATSGPAGIGVDISNHFVNIVMKTSETGTIELDGTFIGDEFTPFPADATISYLQKTISAGVHELTSETPFHAYYYGFGDFDAYSKAGDYSETVDLEYVCLEIEADGIFCVDSLINFTANSNFEIASYNWQTSDSQTSTLASPDFFFNPQGDYTVSLTVLTNSGQSFTETYDLTIQDCTENPCDNDATTTISVMVDCAGNPSQFSYTSTVDFTSLMWDFGDASAGSTEMMPSHIYSIPGTYTVVLTGFDAINCEYTEETIVEIIDCNGCGNPILDISFSGNPCVGEEIIFESTYAGIPSDLVFINWDFGNGFPSNEENPTTVYQFPGTYDVVIDIFDGENDCIYNGTTIITIEDCGQPCTNLPEVNLSNFSGDTQCLGEAGFIFIQTTAQLVDFQWFLNDVLVAEENDTYAPVLTEIGIYTVTLQAMDTDGCEYEAIFELEGVDCDDPCADYDIGLIEVEGEFCIDSLLTFSNSIPDFDATYLWTLDNGENFFDPNFTTVFTEERTVNILLQVVNEEGCEDEANFTLTIENCEPVDDCLLPPESVQLVVFTDLMLCVGDSVQYFFDAEINIVSVLWQTNDGRTYTDFAPFIIGLNAEPLEVNIEAIDENGCIYNDTITTNYFDTCEALCQIFVPNAFTPNDDDANDTFRPLSGCELETYSFEIYSRWGELMFETNDFNESWDGIYRGKPVSSDVYAWVMTYSFTGQESETIVGDISVIR